MRDNVEVMIVAMGAQARPPLSAALALCCPGEVLWETADPVTAMEYLLGCGDFVARDTRGQPVLALLRCAPPLHCALALLSSIRSFAETRTIPVVIVTPRPDSVIVRRCLRAGANSVVADSGDPVVLASKMAAVYAFWVQANETLSMPPPQAGVAVRRRAG